MLFILAIVLIMAVVMILFLVGGNSSSPAKEYPGVSEAQDARRFARLLMAEIKHYNGDKIERSRQQHCIYQELKTEIEQARKHYLKRVRPELNGYQEIFEREVINQLADGDIRRMGAEYKRTE